MPSVPLDPDDTGPPAEPPGEIASLFPVERARLTELLRGLERADWDRPSPCPGWTVLGLCCHLVGDDLSVLSRHRDGHRGTPGPPDDAGEAEFVAWLDDLQAEWVRAARRLSPRVVTDLLEWAGPQVADMVRRQDPRARAGDVSWAGGLVPAWLDQARELSEYWIHRQQLLQALGRPSDLRADLAPRCWTGCAGRTRAVSPAPPASRVRLVAAAPPGRPDRTSGPAQPPAPRSGH